MLKPGPIAGPQPGDALPPRRIADPWTLRAPPGLSSYRTAPVAIGVISLYALLITGLTARYTKRLPRPLSRRRHRAPVILRGATRR